MVITKLLVFAQVLSVNHHARGFNTVVVTVTLDQLDVLREAAKKKWMALLPVLVDGTNMNGLIMANVMILKLKIIC
jgi:hypothetical protein